MSTAQIQLNFKEGDRVVHRQDGSAGIFMQAEGSDLARILFDGAEESVICPISDIEPLAAPAAPVTPTKPVSRFLQVAASCLSRGELRVLPIDVGGKKPLVKWKDTLLDTASTAEWLKLAEAHIEEMGQKFPDANACVVAKPDELLFLDIDTVKQFREAYEKYSSELYPVTYTTSGRENRCQEHWRQTDATRAMGNIGQFQIDGIDFSVRQHNLYVLAEGSRHISGTTYEAIVAAPIVPMPDKLVEFIKYLCERAGKKSEVFTSPQDQNLSLPLKETTAEVLNALAAAFIKNRAPNGIQSGDGHDPFLIALAGALREAGADQSQIEEILIRDGEEVCLGHGIDFVDMCKAKAESAARYPVGKDYTCTIGGKKPGESVPPSASPSVQADEDEEEWEKREKEFEESLLLLEEEEPKTEEEYRAREERARIQIESGLFPLVTACPPKDGAPYFDADNILYGVAGHIIRKIDAESESHPAGNLLEFLVGFGNLLGRGPYFQHESTQHFTNEFGIRVGESSISRKGTGRNRVQELLSKINHAWTSNCVKGGFGSGQAIIQAISDEVRQIRIDAKTKKPAEFIVQQNVPDKRLLISEGEFSGIMKLAAMEGSLFSEVFRNAYDCKKLENTVKGSPCRCAEPFISCSCDTTMEDLRGSLEGKPNAGNGFGNRFMFAYVERTKKIPFGGAQLDWTYEINGVGDSDQKSLYPHIPLRDLVNAAEKREEVKMSWEARRHWFTIYPSFEARVRSMGKTAAVLCTRGEAHVSRLSLIYALLDNSPMIEREHIKAAKALWDYCCDSVEWIFTGKTADLRTIMDQLNPRVASQVKQTAAQIQNAKFREKHSRHPRPLWYVEGCLRYLVKSGYVVRNEGEKGVPSWTRQGAKKNSL